MQLFIRLCSKESALYDFRPPVAAVFYFDTQRIFLKRNVHAQLLLPALLRSLYGILQKTRGLSCFAISLISFIWCFIS